MTEGLPPHTPLTPARRVLALLDEAELKTGTSRFFAGLTRRGHKVTYVRFKEGMNLALKTAGGEWEFDHVVLMSVNKVAPSDRTLVNLLEFVDAGGNLVLATSSKASAWMRDLAGEVGVSLGAEDVVDRFPPSQGGVVSCPWPSSSVAGAGAERVVGSSSSSSSASSSTATVRYSGTTVTPTDAALAMGAVPLLLAPGTAFEPGKASSSPTGSTNLVLVTALQMRNNARVVVLGGAYVFRDEADNELFVSRLAEWAFGGRSVIRVKRVVHRLADGSAPEKQLKHPHQPNPLPKSTFPEPDFDPEAIIYREKDDVEFSLEMEEIVTNPDSGVQTWKPFNANDMQVEFVMLDPYQRVTMTSNGQGVMTGKFKVPDQYGVFKFRVRYNRPGLSNIFVSLPASVRPFRHNEYERFLLAATPYYLSVASIMTAFFVFLAAFMHSSAA